MAIQFKVGSRDEPELNLIPFIDILLVVLIFLMLTTTYSRYTELKINLPAANAERLRESPREIVVAVSQEGHYAVGGQVIEGASVERLADALAQTAASQRDTMVIVSADAAATHQAVVNVMDAARRAGLHQITFATQQVRAR